MNRDDVLKLLFKSGGSFGWDKDARSRADRPPESVLRYLSAEGHIEVETRRCSTWIFGPSHPPYRYGGAAPDPQIEAQKRAYKEFHVKYGDLKKWRDRSEVWARLTDRGMQFMANVGLLD